MNIETELIHKWGIGDDPVFGSGSLKDIQTLCNECAKLRKEVADEERWMIEILTDFKIPHDPHKVGRRVALSKWIISQVYAHTALGNLLRDCHAAWMDSPSVKTAQKILDIES